MNFLSIILTLILSTAAMSFTGDGMPFKYLSSCEIDLNGDGKSDKAILLEGLNGRELIALIATKNGYDTIVVSKGKNNMFLNCKFGNEVKESRAINDKPKTYKTPGTYLELIKPESSAVSYIWNKKGFIEVWSAD